MKVLVIGLDGATFDLIKPWTATGELPTLTKLMENGVYSDLISTIPPVSGPAWASFMTGKNPGKHGVFDFVGRGVGYGLEIKTGRDIKAKTLWRLLSEGRKKCIVLNVPMTYPSEKINGCIVTGMMTPPDACFAHPPWVFEELKELGYRIGARGVEQRFSPKGILDHLVVTASLRVKAMLHLMRKFDWDFAMLVFSGTDKIQHYIWQHHKTTILHYYKRIDAFLKRLIEESGNDTNVFIVSDHGFGPTFKFFHTNYFLHNLGLLEYASSEGAGRYSNVKDYRVTKSPLQKILSRLGITKEKIYITAERLRMIWLLQKIYGKLHITIPTTKKEIDWQRTKAFFNSTIGPSFTIQINLEGREPKGIVGREEYYKLREFIISELLKLKDPGTGGKIVQYAFKKEDIYHGPYISEASDVVFTTKNFEYGATYRTYGNYLVSDLIHKGRGTHRMNGIFIASGPDIKSSKKRDKNARLYDIAPTILHMLNQSVPKDMDGKVLVDVFETNSAIKGRKVKFSESTGLEKKRIQARIERLKRSGRI